jgi:DNA-directed RNA polymerase specialized sigma subunit
MVTRIEKIKWLSRYANISTEYKVVFEVYVSYRLKLLSIKAQVITGMPSGNSMGDKLSNAIVELEKLEEKALAILEELQALRGKIQKTIRSIENNSSKLILTQRYINCYRWKSIAHKTGLSESQLFRLHIMALDELEI